MRSTLRRLPPPCFTLWVSATDPAAELAAELGVLAGTLYTDYEEFDALPDRRHSEGAEARRHQGGVDRERHGLDKRYGLKSLPKRLRFMI